jgi:hypothetical protein
MDDIADIVRAIGQQQAEYVYYRSCYTLFKQLQEVVAEATEDLNGLYERQQPNHSEGLSAVSRVAGNFRLSVQSISSQEKNAQLALAGLCSAHTLRIDSGRTGSAE